MAATGVLVRVDGGGGDESPPPVNFASLDLGASRVRLHYYRRDVRVEILGRPRMGAGGEPPVSPVRGPFSRKSQKRLVWVGANTEMKWESLLTVTYPALFPTDGREAREHLRMLLQAIQRKYGMVGHLWVREYQERGAPHYHILTDVRLSPLDWCYGGRQTKQKHPAWTCMAMHKWVSEAWQGCIKSYSCEEGLRAGCRWEALRSEAGGAAYLAAYASKAQQKVVPDGITHSGRWWGHSRSVRVPPPDCCVEVALTEYIAGVDGDVASPDGWIFTTLHDGRSRAFRWLPPPEKLPGVVGE